MSTRDFGPVIVTGAAGFIGRRLTTMLDQAGIAHTAWTRASVDLTDRDATRARLADTPARTIFHLASAGVSAGSAHESAIISSNLTTMINLVDHAAAGSRIILAGSMSEYGRSGRLSEDDICMPRTAYGISKLAMTLYGLAYAASRNIEVYVARLFGVYGPGETSNRLFQMLIRRLSAREKVPLSDGRQERDFIHVDDACAAMIALACAPGSGSMIVNVGTGSAVRVREVCEWIADAIGADRSLLCFGAYARSPGDEDLLVADTTQMETILGYSPPQRLQPDLSLELFSENCHLWPPKAQARAGGN